MRRVVALVALVAALGLWLPHAPVEAAREKTARRTKERSRVTALLADPAAAGFFLQPVTVTLPRARQGINPVPKSSHVVARRPGLDVINVLLVRRGPNGRYTVTLREQTRAPEAERRRDARRPGGHLWTLSDSAGETLEARRGGGADLSRKLMLGLVEELNPAELAEVDVKHLSDDGLGRLFRRLFRPVARQQGMAFSPDRNAGVANLVVLLEKQGVTPRVKPDQLAPSGEVAENGARVFRDLPLDEAIGYARSGLLTDGRTALALLIAAHRLKVPLPRSLGGTPSFVKRHRWAHALDPDRRRAVGDSAFSEVQLAAGKELERSEWRGDDLAIIARRLTMGTRDGTRQTSDPAPHQVAEAPDQVSELPVVRAPDGRLYVALVPTYSSGVAARKERWLAAKTARPDGPATATVQLRGIVRNVAGYRAAWLELPGFGGGGERGNLGSVPVYGAAIADAHAAFTGMGLIPTSGTWNAGSYNASGGENSFHMNLMVREYRLAAGTTVEGLAARKAIRLMPLDQAIAYALKNPRKVDQMTQLQLFSLALKEQDGRIFQFADR